MSLDDMDAGVQNDPDFIEATTGGDPRQDANISELQQRLNEALQKLSHEHRAVVTMFDIQGMPHAEIAKSLGFQAPSDRGCFMRTASCKIISKSLSNTDSKVWTKT